MANFAEHPDFPQHWRNGNRLHALARVAALVAACLLFATDIGCAKKSRLTVAPVHGSVTYKGQGVPNAIVIFFPTDETAEVVKKIRPFAYADGEGNFDLKTYIKGDGAPPGKYRVSIVAVAGAAAAASGHDPPQGNPSGPKTAVAIPQEVVKKYGNVDTAGLQVTVQDGENDLAPFTL
jgi:hypothetical protein